MASQKRTRSASSQGKSGGTATRSSGSGNATGRSSGNRTASPAAARAVGKPARGAQGVAGRGPADRGQDGRGQNPQAQNGRGRNGRPRNGRPGQGRANGPRATTLPAAQPANATPAARYAAPPWLRWTALGLSLAGLGMSIYMTIAHYTSTSILVCSSKGFVDCAKVTTSPESMVFGVFPVAVLGLAFYVFMVAVNTPWAWRSGIPAIWWARLAGIITGMGFVLYLIYAEIIQIGNICLDCTTVHIITFLLFVLLVFAASIRNLEPAR